jgi:Cu-Zn family superoxide dismutase
MTLKTTVPLLLAAFSLAFAQPSSAVPGSTRSQLGASAELTDAQGNVIGDVNFTVPASDGEQFVTIQLGLLPDAGLEPGEYGFHVHQVGQCSPTFDAAGDHFNPEGAQHGLLDPDGPHAGDLPNVVVAEDGTTTYVVNTRLMTLGEGERSIFDDDGSSVMLHAQADDYLTDPSGTSGDRIACGVIQEEQAEQGQ